MFNFIVIAIVLFVVLYWTYARRRHANVTVYSVAARKFSKAIQPLLKDDDTPISVLDFVAFMNNTIQDNRAARLTLGVFLSKSGVEEKPDEIKEMDVFFEKRPELLESFRLATVSYMTAVTFNGRGLAGYMSRVFLKNMFRRHKDVANTVAQDVYYYGKAKHKSVASKTIPIRSC